MPPPPRHPLKNNLFKMPFGLASASRVKGAFLEKAPGSHAEVQRLHLHLIKRCYKELVYRGTFWKKVPLAPFLNDPKKVPSAQELGVVTQGAFEKAPESPSKLFPALGSGFEPESEPRQGPMIGLYTIRAFDVPPPEFESGTCRFPQS